MPDQTDQVAIDGDDTGVTPEVYPGDAWRLLSPLLTAPRRTKFQAVAAARTSHVRLVVQDIHHPHNVSACLRSAEAFGIQDVDIVTLRESFRASTVAKGVAHWLTIHRHHEIAACAQKLRQSGYRLYAGLPLPGATALAELPVTTPVAVIFGNEHAGIDPLWQEHLDGAFTIPMYGMVESLNISVCAAVTLQHLTAAARSQVPPSTYHLSPVAQENLLNTWVCQQLTGWPEILPRLRG